MESSQSEEISNLLICPVRTVATSDSKEEIRGYKLGKQKFSYNAISVLLQDKGGSRKIASAVEVPIGTDIKAELKQSCLKYDLYLDNGDELCAYIFLVFAKSVGTDQRQQHEWQVVTRMNCLRGCEGPMLQGIRRFGRIAKTTSEERSDRARDPSKLYVAIDEACAHLDHKSPRFRLVLGLYSGKQSTTAVATAVSGAIRVVANNDAPKGSASFALVCKMHGSEALPASRKPAASRPALQEIGPNSVSGATSSVRSPERKDHFTRCKKQERAASGASESTSPDKGGEPLDLTGDAEGPRQQRTLTSLVERLLEVYGARVGSALSLGALAEDLGVKKRRMYDVMNVLESIQVVERRGQDWYTWKGASSIKDALDTLAFEAEMRKTHADNGAPQETVSTSEVPCKDLRALKSLKVLSEEFVQLFLADQGQVLLLEKAVSTVLGGESDGLQSIRRRLYDVANILACLHLVVKLQTSEGPAYLWLGIPGLQERLGEFSGGALATTNTTQRRKRKSDDALSTPRLPQPTPSSAERAPKRRSIELPRSSSPQPRRVRLPSDDFADAFLARSGFRICADDVSEKPSQSGRPPLSPVPLPPRHRSSAPASAFRKPTPLAESAPCQKPGPLLVKPPQLTLFPGAAQYPGQPLASPTLTYNPFQPVQPGRVQPSYALPSGKPSGHFPTVLRPTPRRLPSIPRYHGPAPPGQALRDEIESVRDAAAARLSIPGHTHEASAPAQLSTSDFKPYRQPPSQNLPPSSSRDPLTAPPVEREAIPSSVPEIPCSPDQALPLYREHPSELVAAAMQAATSSRSRRPGTPSEGWYGTSHVACAEPATSAFQEPAAAPGPWATESVPGWMSPWHDVWSARPLELLNDVTNALLLLRNPAVFADAREYTQALADARTRMLPHLPAAALLRQPALHPA